MSGRSKAYVRDTEELLLIQGLETVKALDE